MLTVIRRILSYTKPCRKELLGLEAKVKEIAEQIEGLLKGMRELGA